MRIRTLSAEMTPAPRTILKFRPTDRTDFVWPAVPENKIIALILAVALGLALALYLRRKH